MSQPAYKLNLFQVMGVKASAEQALHSLLRANEGKSMNSAYFCILHSYMSNFDYISSYAHSLALALMHAIVLYMSMVFQDIHTIYSAGTYVLLVLAVCPKPWCYNWLFIGKCYLTQGRRTEATTWFQKVVNIEHPIGVLEKNVRQ